MKNITKKITSLLFITLGFIPMLFALVFILKQQSVRHYMKERLEEEILHTLTLPDNEVHWMEEGKEIVVNGRMFDVKSVEHSAGMTILHGLFDDEETALNKTFGQSWEKESFQQNLLLAQLFQCLRNFYFEADPDVMVPFQKQQHLTVLSSPKLLSPFKLILTPPPQA